MVQVTLFGPEVLDDAVVDLGREVIASHCHSYLLEVTISLFSESFDPRSHNPFILDTFIRIPPINLQKFRQIKANLGLDLRPIRILILMLTRPTLYLQMLHNILLDLFFPLRPDIRTEDADQHAGVDADGEQQHEGYEEDHGDWVGSACYDC